MECFPLWLLTYFVVQLKLNVLDLKTSSWSPAQEQTAEGHTAATGRSQDPSQVRPCGLSGSGELHFQAGRPDAAEDVKKETKNGRGRCKAGGEERGWEVFQEGEETEQGVESVLEEDGEPRTQRGAVSVLEEDGDPRTQRGAVSVLEEDGDPRTQRGAESIIREDSELRTWCGAESIFGEDENGTGTVVSRLFYSLDDGVQLSELSSMLEVGGLL
ncbi:hypothetical protein NDU88_000169 [Pleurodeles waltl]|uniref:Uncharacterized protein n=1 Tax=Pleurodeles waltl TaxID=8319 RepID=A0AAV7L9F9_PLEWA|nr:hypothetical protein NDU88_000169 [Pleurodeles waltl]